MQQPEPTSEIPVASFSDGFSFQTTNCLEGPNSVLAMASQQVITVQPQCSAAPRAGEWQSGLMDCCSDCNVCLCGTFCFPCLGCQVAEDMDECCMCGPSMAMRTLYRTRYNIPMSPSSLRPAELLWAGVSSALGCWEMHHGGLVLVAVNSPFAGQHYQ
uniref:Uncharacterized protein n=1 Tax=Amazona collaria TaxID=241587 RepID=A0A8B9FXK0_9PSIT